MTGNPGRLREKRTESSDLSSIALIAAVNDEEVLRQNLAESPEVASGAVGLIALRNHTSAASAYNAGLARCATGVVVFAHQDVYLPCAWLARLRSAIEQLESERRNWAVLGVFGADLSEALVGHVWSNGLGCELGQPFATPRAVVSIDEMVIVLRRASGLGFDEGLPGFHLYGTDIVQTALSSGFEAYVFDGPAIHNSLPVHRLDTSYWEAYRYLQRKWRTRLPIATCIVPITRMGWSRWRYRLRALKRRLRGRARTTTRHFDPAALAADLGYEERPAAESAA